MVFEERAASRKHPFRHLCRFDIQIKHPYAPVTWHFKLTQEGQVEKVVYRQTEGVRLHIVWRPCLLVGLELDSFANGAGSLGIPTLLQYKYTQSTICEGLWHCRRPE